MYGPPHASMNEQHHEPEDVDCSDGDDATDNPPTQIRYDGPNSAGTVLDAVGSHALFAPDMASHLPPPSEDGGADQLSLSFQGQVYVFDSVSPEKVQAVLLLLGGYEVPTGIPSPGMTPQNQRTMADYPGRSSQPQRAASLNRFREKRKERCFEKKIRYTVRKEVALRMQRKKGQFTSSKSVVDDQGSSSADGNGSSGQEEQETSCRHCGISSKSTPMMRRGPDGPRTLCNACGLKWANKGILRDLSKVPIVTPQAPSILTQDLSRVPLMMQNHPMKVNGEANGESIVIPATNILSK